MDASPTQSPGGRQLHPPDSDRDDMHRKASGSLPHGITLRPDNGDEPSVSFAISRCASETSALRPHSPIQKKKLTNNASRRSALTDYRLRNQVMEDGTSLPNSQSMSLVTAPSLSTSPRTRSRTKRRKRALIVDDVAVSQRITSVALHRAGFVCDTAANGEDAVTMAGNNDYDVIFMDILLPGMDGATAARIIRQQEQDNGEPPILIFAFTSQVNTEAQAQYAASGINACLEKGCVVGSAIHAAMNALDTNAGFVFVNGRNVLEQRKLIDSDIDRKRVFHAQTKSVAQGSSPVKESAPPAVAPAAEEQAAPDECS